MTGTRPLIYLAGPGVFRIDADQYGKTLKRLCRSFGLEGLWPLDGAPGPKNETLAAAAHRICAGNKRLIDRADAVLADIIPFRGPNMDPGTAFEIGYANATGTPVFAFTYDARSLLQRTLAGAVSTFGDGTVHDSNSMLIEDFGLFENLMIACSVKGIYRSAGEALLAAANVLVRKREAVG